MLQQMRFPATHGVQIDAVIPPLMTAWVTVRGTGSVIIGSLIVISFKILGH